MESAPAFGTNQDKRESDDLMKRFLRPVYFLIAILPTMALNSLLPPGELICSPWRLVGLLPLLTILLGTWSIRIEEPSWKKPSRRQAGGIRSRSEGGAEKTRSLSVRRDANSPFVAMGAF